LQDGERFDWALQRRQHPRFGHQQIGVVRTPVQALLVVGERKLVTAAVRPPVF
jgi:hypothetical protein